jgi:hypothetical protein
VFYSEDEKKRDDKAAKHNLRKMERRRKRLTELQSKRAGRRHENLNRR